MMRVRRAVGCATLALFLVVLSACCDDEEIQKSAAENMRRGDLVILQLNSYRQRIGAYPPSLQMLEDTLDNELLLPTGCSTRRWKYAVQGDTFILSFTVDEEHEYPIWYYKSPDGRWRADQ